MRMTATSAYENIWIYYMIIVVNLVHVSVIICGYIQGGVFTNDMLQTQTNLKTLNTKF